MMNLAGKRVLITGAASGIGKIMLGIALEKGAKLVYAWDRDVKGLEALYLDFKPHSSAIRTHVMDLSSLESIQAHAQLILQEEGGIDVLINNAGIVVGKMFHEHSLQDIEQSMQINAIALMQLTHYFLPGMMERNHGAICNIASLASLVANPKMSVYAASKWAVMGWSDSLRLEMRRLNKSVKVTTVMPYYISTGMFDGVKSPLIPIIKPEFAAKKIIRGIEKGASMVAMPLPYWFVRLAQGIMPLSAYDWIMQHVLKVYSSMDDFKGKG